jgi:hypothetical protein
MTVPQIVSVTKSSKKGKKLKATLNDGKVINFGSSTSETFVEGASQKKRENYLKRHLANTTEKRLIENLKPSPALLSADLLWGETNNLNQNIKMLNKRLRSKFHQQI